MNHTQSDPISIAREYAYKCHHHTNHLYDGQPYSAHLEMVVAMAHKYINLIDQNKREDVISACYCHDTIEDTRQTYSDVVRNTNTFVADLVYAVTNEKGRTRKERADDRYYAGIRDMGKEAVFVKMCDRLANVSYSKSSGGKMLDLYRSENPDFEGRLYRDDLQPMFADLQELLK
jgi:(p)ppGpp synthase/HD superfamily hydrolase